MVRGKVKLQRIDDGARRMVSFSKRRSGLLKKARELAVLCDAEVGVVVFSPKGKLSHFSSQSSLEKTFERCKRFLDEERKVKNNVLIRKGKSAEFADHEMNHGIKVDQRLLDDGLIEHDINELTKLEEKVECELRKIRLRKTALLKDSGANLQDPGRTLVFERQQLRSVMVTDGEGTDEEDEHRSSQRAPESGASSSSNAASPPGPLRTLQLFVDA